MMNVQRAAKATLLTGLSLLFFVVAMAAFGMASAWILARDLWVGFYRE